MRLISLHTDAVRALERLRVPFDDLTPEGLWGSPYHLIGLTAEQRAVLDAWNLDVNDVTPQAVASAAGLTPQLRETWPQASPQPLSLVGSNAQLADVREPERDEGLERVPSPSKRTMARPKLTATPAPVSEPSRDAEVAVPMHEEPKKHGDPLEREIVGQAAAAAEAQTAVSTNANGAQQAASAAGPTRLRVSVGGKYREATVQQGKILLDGRSYDSPAEASKSVAQSKGDWLFWEYFDAEAGRWRILDRDWQPQQTA